MWCEHHSRLFGFYAPHHLVHWSGLKGGLFAGRGVEIDKGQRTWYVGRQLINSYRMPLAECSLEELWRGQLDLELTQLDSLAQQLADVERRLEVIAKDDERIQRVQTIPGVGRRTAEALVTALDDVDRFDKLGDMGCHLS